MTTKKGPGRQLLPAGLLACALISGPAEVLAQGDDPEIRLDSIAPGVWLHTSYGPYPGLCVPSNGLVVREGDHLVLIDTAWGELATVRLLEVIRAKIGLPVTSAVVTHAHYDRIAGAHFLQNRGAVVLGSSMTRRLANHQGLPAPDTIPGLARAGSTSRIRSLEVHFPGPGHSPDNVMVWLPASRILFAGCAVRDASATSLGNVEHADLSGWPRAIADAIRRYPDARLVVPGHGRVGGLELLHHTMGLLTRDH